MTYSDGIKHRMVETVTQQAEAEEQRRKELATLQAEAERLLDLLEETGLELARLREENASLRGQLAHWTAVCEAAADPLPFCDDTEVDA